MVPSLQLIQFKLIFEDPNMWAAKKGNYVFTVCELPSGGYGASISLRLEGDDGCFHDFSKVMEVLKRMAEDVKGDVGWIPGAMEMN